MSFSARFYRIAAVCSLASAVTTLLLIFVPRFFEPLNGFETRMARVNEPAYLLRSWAYLVHPFLTVAAALAVAARLRLVAAGLVVPGFLGFLLWGSTEAAQQALTIMAFDRWRAAYLAGDEAVRATMTLRVALYDGLWDALYFLLLIAFLIGNVFYAVATSHGGGLTRALSALYTGAALLTVSILVTELGGPALPPLLSAWLYPAIQPLARTLIGVWLWRYANESTTQPLAAVVRREP